MKDKKIIIAGGSGFIGQELIRYFGKENSIIVLSRQLADAGNNRNHYDSISAADMRRTKVLHWDGRSLGPWATEFEGADLVINLAGRTVNCRYTEKNKKEIFDSRVHSVEVIGAAIRQCKQAPSCWINASSATIYRHAEDHAQDEYNGEYEDDFSVQVCKRWEKALYDEVTPGTRKIALRMAITLGTGGVLIPYFNLLKFGLGGKQGSGKQMYSWIHIEDSCRMIEWLYEQQRLEGTFNCSSPNPVSNSEFMRELRAATGQLFGLPAYTWMLKIGALVIGTPRELVLKSRWVVPTRILETGFQFKYPLIKDAMRDLISQVPVKQYHLFRR